MDKNIFLSNNEKDLIIDFEIVCENPLMKLEEKNLD